MTARISRASEQEIIDAYEAWDPQSTSIDDLAKSLHTSKQTIYTTLHRNNVPLKSARDAAGKVQVPDVMLDRMADRALTVILEELVFLRNENAELRERLGEDPRV